MPTEMRMEINLRHHQNDGKMPTFAAWPYKNENGTSSKYPDNFADYALISKNDVCRFQLKSIE